jgi:hypothetical protein
MTKGGVQEEVLKYFGYYRIMADYVEIAYKKIEKEK